MDPIFLVLETTPFERENRVILVKKGRLCPCFILTTKKSDKKSDEKHMKNKYL